MLSDTTTYKKLDSDPAPAFSRALTKLVEEGLSVGFVT